MANWFAYHHINQAYQASKQNKPSLPIMVISLLMILLGTWLLIALLNLRGIHLLGEGRSNQTLDQAENFHTAVKYWEKQILTWADTYHLDPLLIATVMQIESCGDPQAVSPAGAQGLFQVMPYHFQPGEDMLDPQTNAQRGLTYLGQSLQKANGDIKLALAGYNGGHSQIQRDPADWPSETKRYVHWGYGIYQDALAGNIHENTLSEWLRAGGWHLCKQAETRLINP